MSRRPDGLYEHATRLLAMPILIVVLAVMDLTDQLRLPVIGPAAVVTTGGAVSIVTGGWPTSPLGWVAWAGGWVMLAAVALVVLWLVTDDDDELRSGLTDKTEPPPLTVWSKARNLARLGFLYYGAVQVFLAATGPAPWPHVLCGWWCSMVAAYFVVAALGGPRGGKRIKRYLDRRIPLGPWGVPIPAVERASETRRVVDREEVA